MCSCFPGQLMCACMQLRAGKGGYEGVTSGHDCALVGICVHPAQPYLRTPLVHACLPGRLGCSASSWSPMLAWQQGAKRYYQLVADVLFASSRPSCAPCADLHGLLVAQPHLGQLSVCL